MLILAIVFIWIMFITFILSACVVSGRADKTLGMK